MGLELLKYIDMDMKWNVMKKGRTNLTRRPRKPRADSFVLGVELDNKILERCSFVAKKCGTEKVVDAPIKKRKLLRESPSLLPQTLCLNGEGCWAPRPQTPLVGHEDSGQRCCSNSLNRSQKTKSKTGVRSSKILKLRKKQVYALNDFSGIELLAGVACSTLIRDSANHVKDLSVKKEHITPRGKSCYVDKKEAVMLTESDIGNEGKEKKVDSSKELRLHWDLNTVMDEWEEPRDNCVGSVKCKLEGYEDRCTEAVGVEERYLLDSVYVNQLSVKHDTAISVAPLVKTCNDKLTSLQEVTGANPISSKTSYVESSASKSDVIDSSSHPVKCEDFSTSTTSVLRKQTIVKVESDTIDKSDQQPVFEVMQGGCQSTILDNKVTSEDPVISDCCGSNVTQEEQGHTAEGDSEKKVQVGYDSPFEDGELREPIEEKETVDCESDTISKDNSGTLENPSSEKVNHGQTKANQSLLMVKGVTPSNDIQQGAKADIFEKPHSDESSKGLGEREVVQDESTSSDVCTNAAYVPQSRPTIFVDSYSRSGRDASVEKSIGRDTVSYRDCSRFDSSNHNRNYNSYRSQYRRSSPSERNNGYDSSNYRGPPVRRRSHSRDRDRERERDRYSDRYRGGFGFHPQKYQDRPKPGYLERKPCFPCTQSRSRSRSGSPVAWNFQKRKNLETSNSGEIGTITKGDHVSPGRSSKCFGDRRISDGQFRDSRMIQQDQRFGSSGYNERLKSDDHFRFTQRPANFSHRYNDNGGDAIRKHDGDYDKVKRVGRSEDGGGIRPFRYVVDNNRRNLNSFPRDAGNEHTTVSRE